MQNNQNLPTCLVLMCTYNGEKYLREQIDSILNQTKVEVTLKVADDRSTDGTVAILEEYKSKYSNFDFYINETNKKFTYNFLDLLFSVKDSRYDYYAFSDQDDFWQENKIIEAIKLMEKQEFNENGILYLSNQNVVDSNLEFIRHTYEKDPQFKNRYCYLSENIATGCTMVFNQLFKNNICSYYPKNIYLHDFYIFLLAIFTASYVYDHNAYIKYRQHGNNQIGAKEDKTSLIKKIKRTMKRKYSTATLANELLAGYKEKIANKDFKYIYMCAKYKDKFFQKLKLIFTTKIHPHTHILNFKIKVMINKY